MATRWQEKSSVDGRKQRAEGGSSAIYRNGAERAMPWSDYSTPYLHWIPLGSASGWYQWVAPVGENMEQANGTSCLTSCKSATEPAAPPSNRRHPLTPPLLVSHWLMPDPLSLRHLAHKIPFEMLSTLAWFNPTEVLYHTSELDAGCQL